LEHRLGVVLHVLLGVGLLFVAVVALVDPREPNMTYSTWRVLVCMLALLAVSLLSSWAARRWNGPQRRHGRRRVPGRVTAAVVALAGAAGCTVLAWLLRYDVGWDAGVVAGMAQRLHGGQTLTTYQAGYLSRYPNNLPLLVVDRACERVAALVGATPGQVFVLLNGVGLAATLLATAWLVRMLRGPRAALVAQGLVLALVGLSPWMTVPYTDLLAMPLVVAGTACVVAAGRTSDRRRLLVLASVSALCLLLAYEVKSTPVVSAVAVVLVVVLASLGGRRHPAGRRAVLVALASGLTVLVLGALLARPALPAMAGVPAGSIDRSRTATTPWWVYMATTQHPVDGRMRYGGYDPEIVRATNRMDGEQAGQWALPRLEHRLQALGAPGYARFLAAKAAWNWGDGMFWAWGEGHDAAEHPLARGRAASFVQTWNRPDGAAWVWRTSMTQALWLALLLVAALRLLRAPWRPGTGLLVLSILGIAAFTLVFQGRSRYLLVYVPVLAALVTALPAPAWRRGAPTSRPAGPGAPTTSGRDG